MSITLIEIHERMEDGPLYSPISHVVWFLRCILCQTHFTRLAIDHESCWAMVAQDTHISFTYWRYDYYFTGCGHNSKIMYSWPPITGICDIDWSLLCSELLGMVPPPSQIRGLAISAWWLRKQFSYPPAGVDDVILQCYTRAFILALLGGALFVDKTSTHVQLCYLPLLRDFIEIFHYS